MQTSNDKIGEILHRGYTSKQFTEAVNILNEYGIDVVVHMMIGLPKETKEDILETVRFINQHKVQGIKIHSTYVVENTILAEMYRKGEYTPLELDDYIEDLNIFL